MRALSVTNKTTSPMLRAGVVGEVTVSNSRTQTAIAPQQFFESQQSQLEKAQIQAEKAQIQAEDKQIQAESQHQYEEAQRWYEKARQNLRLSQQMRSAQVELQAAQGSLLLMQHLLPGATDVSEVPNRSRKSQQPNLNSFLVQSCVVMASLIGWFLAAVMFIVLLLSFMDARKREFS